MGHADHINSFYREYLNPCLNYHRPCAQADVEIDEKGRKLIRYKRYQTPLETLLALDKPAQYLRQGLSINALKRIAGTLSDTDATRRMQQAKAKLFGQLTNTWCGWSPDPIVARACGTPCHATHPPAVINMTTPTMSSMDSLQASEPIFSRRHEANAAAAMTNWITHSENRRLPMLRVVNGPTTPGGGTTTVSISLPWSTITKFAVTGGRPS